MKFTNNKKEKSDLDIESGFLFFLIKMSKICKK